MKWYGLAAEQGFARGQYDLDIMYAKGEGVPQDYVRAYMWFNLAATNGLGEAARDRESVIARMTPAQIAEAQRLAREWKPK
jgi:TPR repeat protein